MCFNHFGTPYIYFHVYICMKNIFVFRSFFLPFLRIICRICLSMVSMSPSSMDKWEYNAYRHREINSKTSCCFKHVCQTLAKNIIEQVFNVWQRRKLKNKWNFLFSFPFLFYDGLSTFSLRLFLFDVISILLPWISRT